LLGQFQPARAETAHGLVVQSFADHRIRQKRQRDPKFLVRDGVIPFSHGGLRAPERFFALR
jgi:hypothetical protein